MGRFRKKFLASAVDRVSQHLEQKVYLSISGLFQKKKKQAGWLRKCLCKYSTNVSGFVLEILEKLQVWIHKVCNTHWKYQGQIRGPLKYVAQKLSNSLQEIPHVIPSTHSHFRIFKPIVWASTGIVWFRRMFGLWQVVNENYMW